MNTVGQFTVHPKTLKSDRLEVRLRRDSTRRAGPTRVLGRTLGPVGCVALAIATACVFGADTRPIDALQRARITPALIGPGAGGYMFGVWVRPGEPNYLVTGGDMGSSFWSEDGGKSWRCCNPDINSTDSPSGVAGLCFDRRDRNIVWFASSQGVYLTMDHYRTWRRMTPPQWAGLGPHTIVQDPTDADVLWVGFGSSSQSLSGLKKGPLACSRDGGRTWLKITGGGFPPDPGIREIVIEPTSEYHKGWGHKTIFVATLEGILASEDFGKNWERRDHGISPGFLAISDLKRVRHNNTTRYFAGVWYKISSKDLGRPKSIFYTSDDLGRTWQSGSTAGMVDFHHVPYMLQSSWDNGGTMMSFCEMDPNVVWLVSWWKVFRSTDFGQSWTRVKGWYKKYQTTQVAGESITLVLNNADANVDGGWRAGAENTERVTATADPAVAYLTDGLYATRDAGKSWFSLCDTRVKDDQGRPTWKGTGVCNLMGMRVTTDPANHKKVFMAYNDLGLIVSSNGGETSYIARDARAAAAGMSISSEAYAVCYDNRSEPGNRVWVSQIDETNGACHVYVSDDDGFTFKRVGAADVSGLVVSIAVNPDSPTDAREVFLAAAGKGIYRSADGGKAWQLLTSEAMGTQPLVSQVAWGRTTAAQVQTVWFAIVGEEPVPRPGWLVSTVAKVYASGNKPDSHSGLYRSHDHGQNWQRVGQKELGDRILCVRVHPAKPEVVYCTAWNGFFKSTDQGATWIRLWTSLEHTCFDALDLHPTNPDVAYFSQRYQGPMSPAGYARRPYGLYKTTDGGKSFIYLDGIPGKTICDIRVCPDDPHVIYIATTSMGFFRIEDPG